MAGRTPPQHGERRCYLHGCRRPECLNAHYRYMSRLNLEHSRGQKRRVDAAPVTAHLNLFIEAGWKQAQIERATGVNHRTLGPLLAGTYPRVHATTARKVFALEVGPPPVDLDTDATGTTRRLQALVAIGHNYPAIAAAVGIHKDALGVVARGGRTSVRVTTAQAVARAYKKLSRTAGASIRARAQAAELGWHGPLAWDDATIDDPAAEPESDTGTDHLPRNELAVVRRSEVEHLNSFGLSEEDIAARLGMALSTVQTIVRELRTGQRRYRGRAAA
ncbi:hypothetical protein [Streptomyces sp. NPDC060322]|uniref:hypothetical protein n=1 Tax=Streptomyces sp. NPDC060322 TaxID=3347097 RepID=UPI003662F4C8